MLVLACWLACLLRAGCASGTSATGASLAGWLAGWLACSVLVALRAHRPRAPLLLVGLLAGLLAPCWLCFGRIGLARLSCWLACWLACLLRAGCASGASATGAFLASWFAC